MFARDASAMEIKENNCQELGGGVVEEKPYYVKLSEDVTDIDFEVTCVSCRKDESDSGSLTSYFYNSTQSFQVHAMNPLQLLFCQIS